MRAKKDLVRIVRTPEGSVELDKTGRKNGRGAYLCMERACLDRAIKTKALERALEIKLDAAALAALEEAFGDGGSKDA